MSYAHRYYYAGGCMLLIMLAGYVFDVRDLMAERVRIIADTEHIKSKIIAAKRARQLAASHSDQDDEAIIADRFSHFSRLARSCHLEILSAVSRRTDTESLVPTEEYQVVLRGSYAGLYQFIGSPLIAEMKAITLSPELQQRVQAEMRVRFSDEIAAENTSFSDAINPFCGAEKPRAAKEFSRDEMQFLGEMVRDGQRYRIELSPDGVMKEVREG